MLSNQLISQMIIGLFFGGVIGYLAYQVKALSGSGAWAAMFTGGLIFGLGGMSWAILLIIFFISSSGLSKMFTERKKKLEEKFEKGSQRDWKQVFANGGLGIILVVIHTIWPEQLWPWVAYAGVLATANSDTWATEIGVMSVGEPRLITNGMIVERGTSGGVSWLGVIATIAGGAFIGIFGGLFTNNISFIVFLSVITTAGLSGSLFDSFLGATVQGMYYCPKDKKDTEHYPLHSCGTKTKLIRGWQWLDNDVVNLLSSGVGGLVAMSILAIL